MRRAWQVEAPPCPQLYLYSSSDALIPHQHIELFMAQQAARGAEVQAHCWRDSAHVEHYRKHPEEYRNLLRSFAEHCLYGQPSPPASWI